MDSRRHVEDRAAADAALDFVKFCHRRRRVGWPELYDEMCAVACRGLYHGWGFGELAEHGIAFGLAEMPRLAGLVSQIAREDVERRGRLLVGVMAPLSLRSDAPEEASDEASRARMRGGTAGGTRPRRARPRSGWRGDAASRGGGRPRGLPLDRAAPRQARSCRRAISASIWRSASVYESIRWRSSLAGGVYR